MPRRYRRRYRRRRIRKGNMVRLNRYRRFAKQTNNLSRVMIGFPTNQVVKMRYSNWTNFPLNTGNSYSEFTVRAASINAPDIVPNANSHQALGHDQWAVFYERYVVLGSRITITGISNNSSAGGNILLGVYLADQSATAAINPHQLIEQGKCNYTNMGNGNAGQLVRKIVNMNYSAKKWHNVTNVKDADNLEANFGANPADQAYFHIFCGCSDMVALTNGSVTIQYKVDYIVLVKDPLELAQS